MNAVASSNIEFIVVALLTFQLSMLWLNELGPLNMRLVSVTPERSGVSLACTIIFAQPANALCIEVHVPVPHCSMVSSFSLSPPPLK